MKGRSVGLASVFACTFYNKNYVSTVLISKKYCEMKKLAAAGAAAVTWG